MRRTCVLYYYIACTICLSGRLTCMESKCVYSHKHQRTNDSSTLYMLMLYANTIVTQTVCRHQLQPITNTPTTVTQTVWRHQLQPITNTPTTVTQSKHQIPSTLEIRVHFLMMYTRQLTFLSVIIQYVHVSLKDANVCSYETSVGSDAYVTNLAHVWIQSFASGTRSTW